MKGIKYIQFILLALSLVLFVAFFFTVKTADDAMMNVYLYWAYFLVAVTVGLVLIFSLAKTLSSKKGLKNLLLLVIGIIVIVGGAYLLAPGTPVETNVDGVTDSIYKFTDVALYVTYVFVFGSVLAIVWSAVHKAIKNR